MSDSKTLIGKKVDAYEVESHLAQGGMADVYLARDKALDRQVILKVLLPAFAQDEEFVERFRREAQAMARLQHPNIVQVYAVGTTPSGQAYIAMQYIDGGSLDNELDRLLNEGKRLAPDYALAIVRQMAQALGVAHQAGMVHRDVKPSNVLLKKDGVPMLTDLGIAIMDNNPRLTRTHSLIGTPDYMSPEQAEGLELDGRSDLYSLGIILYELLAGVRPFVAESPWAIIHKQLYEESVPLQQIRPNLAQPVYNLVQRAMQKKREARFASADEFVATLDNALIALGSGGTTTATGRWQWGQGRSKPASQKMTYPPMHSPSNSTGGHATQKPNRNYWLYGGLGAIVLFALIGFGFALRPANTTPANNQVAEAGIAPTNTSDATEITAVPTIESLPTSTVQAVPIIVEGDIRLLRPTADTTQINTESTTFSWRWSEPLTEEQYFAVYLVPDGLATEIPLGQTNQRGTSNTYNLEVVLADFTTLVGRYQWLVRLEMGEPNTTLQLLASDSQPLLVTTANAVADTDEPVATDISPTTAPSRTPTIRPTNTAVASPTPLATPRPTQIATATVTPTSAPSPPPPTAPPPPPPTAPPPPPPTAPPPPPPTAPPPPPPTEPPPPPPTEPPPPPPTEPPPPPPP